MLVDNVRVYLKAGDGGNGCVSFRREKYVSHGGPDGGDGGNGGDIVLTIDEGANTLLAYKYRHKFIAANGGDGMAGKCHGATADELILPVPPGTVVKEAASGKVICDMSNIDRFVICKGGRGGWGNRHFATPTRQIPRFAKSGMKGEELEVIFELKMIADVGLIGYPNVGKSSILSMISAAKPKVANYHFTTLSPSLGVVKSGGEGKGFVAADIPGLIEGAAEGAGLGHEFLRHVDRCRLLVHVVDISCAEGRNPVEDIKTINAELARYSEQLASRPQIIAANKYDSLDEEAVDLDAFEAYVDELGCDLIYVSAATGENIPTLVNMCSERLKLLPPVITYESEYVKEVYRDEDDHAITIRNVNGTYVVEGEWLLNLMGSINFEDRESLMYFQRVLRNSGVIAALEEKGCGDGDTVSIYDFEFDFVR
ncbi:MAG: GTPase ObgE [Clostridia bacterium]|nr:GTPase ObgE [Clostridia bacterium]